MAQPLEIQRVFSDVSAGVINGVKWSLVPPNSVDLGINFVFDEVLGEAIVRKGTTIIGSQLTGFSNAINGMFFFENTSGSTSILLGVANNGSNNVVYYFSGGWNAGLQTDTAGAKTRFVAFLNYVVRLNGTDAIKSSANGQTWAVNTALDDANFPIGKFAIVYKDQVVVAGKSGDPDALYVSSVPNAAGTAISWSTGDRRIVVNPEDGQNITALGKVSGLCIIFKDRAMYRWNNRSTDADEIISVGCSSQESVVNCGGSLLAFFNPKGIWITSGEQPILISRRVQKWIDGMSASFYDDVAGYGDEDHLYMSIGDVTVDGKSYSNVVLRYSTNSKEWTVFSYAHEFRAFVRYIDSGVEKIVGGDSLNTVYQTESSSLTDAGTNISFEMISSDVDMGSRGILKEISERIMAYGINPANVLVQVRVGNKFGVGDWITIGSMDKSICNFEPKSTIKGNYFNFRIIGTSSTKRFRFQGLELPKVSMHDFGVE